MKFTESTVYLDKLGGDRSLVTVTQIIAETALGLSKRELKKLGKTGFIEFIQVEDEILVRASSVIREIDRFLKDATRLKFYVHQQAIQFSSVHYEFAIEKLGLSCKSKHDTSRFDKLLEHISRESWSEDGVNLAAIVHKETGGPPPVFFTIAEQLDPAGYRSRKSRKEYASHQLDRVLLEYGF